MRSGTAWKYIVGAIAGAMITLAVVSLLSIVPMLSTFAASDDTDTSISETVDVSPFAEVDYSDTELSGYESTLLLTNATVVIADRAAIEQAIAVIETAQSESTADDAPYTSELTYLQSLLLKIEALEQAAAEEFCETYADYFDVTEESLLAVSGSDTVSASDVLELLDAYFVCSAEVQAKICALQPDTMSVYLELYDSAIDEYEEFAAKYSELLSTSSGELSEIVSAIADFGSLSEMAQLLMSDVRQQLDAIMAAYIASSLETSAESNDTVSDSDQTGSVVSPSDSVVSATDTDDYIVYDTGDASLAEVATAMAMSVFSLLVISIIIMLKYADMGLYGQFAYETAREASRRTADSFRRFNVWRREFDFDLFSEDVYERLCYRVDAFKEKHERVNYIYIVDDEREQWK